MTGVALVTGGSGFIGAHVAHALAQRGVKVRILDRSEPVNPPPGAEVVLGSVTDAATVTRAMQGVDSLYHLAAIAILVHRDLATVNVEGVRTVLRAAEEAGVQRAVHVSSLTTLVASAGPREPTTLDESIELDPSELCGAYPRSKRTGELIAMGAAARGLPVAIAMPTLPVGPGDRSVTPPTRMIADFAAGRTPAALETNFNMVDVRDLADGIIAVAERGRAGERYLLGGEDLSVTEMLAELEQLAGRSMPSARVPYAVAWLAAAIDTHLVSPVTRRSPTAPLTGVRLARRPVRYSSEKAARELNWRARPAREALADAVAWLREEGVI